MGAIKIQNLTKKYKDVTALNSLNLEIYEGELFSLLGVNGAGKTTAIKLLSCLAKASSGDAFLMNNSITANPDKVKAIIGISPQETAVAMGLTVKENLELMCGAHGYNKEKTEKKIKKLTEEFGLGKIFNKKAGKLSGGCQRRLIIAMALVGESKILFLDEPTLGLDVIARSELWDIIKSLKGKITVILTTHYMEIGRAHV